MPLARMRVGLGAISDMRNRETACQGMRRNGGREKKTKWARSLVLGSVRNVRSKREKREGCQQNSGMTTP